MKVLGITAEYDPFHNGHRYHLDRAKAMVSPDVTICAMSGDITQRGELAVLDKWSRAKIAVDQGLDLLIELPFLSACSPAGIFASGAVDILVRAGATYIAFGCEAEEPAKLEELARLQIEKADAMEEAVRIEMKNGISHVKARQKASNRIIGEDLTKLSLAPNNILALEYLKRMILWRERGRDITPVPIVRKGSGYKGVEVAANIGFGSAVEDGACSGSAVSMAGGSAIRTMIEAKWDVSGFIPYNTDNCHWIDLRAAGEEMLKQLKGIVLRSSAPEISEIRFIGEGIENRLVREIAEASDYRHLLKRMTSRRYTTSTIRRILMNLLLGVTREMVNEAETGYGRILAMSGPGRALIASEPGLTFVANVNRTGDLSDAARRSIALDIRAADLYNLLTGQDSDENSDHRRRPYVR